MKKILLILMFLAFTAAMSNADSTAPRNEAEAFPARNQNPQLGIIINEGTVHLNLYVYDQANRLVEQAYVPGVNRHLTINGQRIPKYWIRELEIGVYRVEIYPFYYYETKLAEKIINAIFRRPTLDTRYRIDLPRWTAYVLVDRSPTDYYDYATGRHWAWISRLNGGNIPDTAHGLPGINIDLQGDVWGLLKR